MKPDVSRWRSGPDEADVGDDVYVSGVISDGSTPVAMVLEPFKADFILRCVKAHEPLVRLLKEWVATREECQHFSEGCRCLKCRTRAVMATIEEEAKDEV